MNDSNTALERREIHFAGSVQGVGFRYTTRAIAARFPVAGFVQNLADGRVLLVAQGPRDQLDRFVGALEDEMGRYIAHKDVAVLPATDELTRFEVRR